MQGELSWAPVVVTHLPHNDAELQSAGVMDQNRRTRSQRPFFSTWHRPTQCSRSLLPQSNIIHLYLLKLKSAAHQPNSTDLKIELWFIHLMKLKPLSFSYIGYTSTLLSFWEGLHLKTQEKNSSASSEWTISLLSSEVIWCSSDRPWNEMGGERRWKGQKEAYS